MTEQTREAARYQPERFAVFYLFEDIHIGELPETPPQASLRVDGGDRNYRYGAPGSGLGITTSMHAEGYF